MTTTAERPERPGSALPGVRVGALSLVWRPWAVLATVALLAATSFLFCLSIGVGDYQIGLPDVLRALVGHGDRLTAFVVSDLRLPRALVAVIVGGALGVSGGLTQSLARNPLASPDVLGVTQGAGVVAVFGVTATGGLASTITGTLGLPVAALAGGLGTGLLVYVLAWRRGIDGFRLILVGVAVSAVMEAVTTWLLVTADIDDVARAQAFLVGSLEERSWSQVWPALGLGVVLLAVVAAGSFGLRGLHLGDDVAAGLGVRLGLVRGGLLLCAVLLAGLAVGAAGPIPFVALVAPQVAMRVLRLPTPPLAASGLAGAVLLLGSDLVARTLLPITLPVGIVTAAIGGPFLVFLLVRANLRRADT